MGVLPEVEPLCCMTEDLVGLASVFDAISGLDLSSGGRVDTKGTPRVFAGVHDFEVELKLLGEGERLD